MRRFLNLSESAVVTRPDESVAPSESHLSPARRLLVIHNPTAGRGERRRLAAILAAFRKEAVHVELQATASAGDAERVARDCRSDIDVLVVAGGDGTINEATNGLMAWEGASVLALGIIPIGTTNVLARDLRIPRQADALARLLAHGRTREIHVGCANGRYFSLMCGVGMDAHIVNRTSLRLKKRIGKLAYVLQGLRELVAGVPRRYRVEIDGSEVVEAASVIVAKSRFYGGEFQLAPQADIGKPEFQVCLFLRGGRLSTLLYIIGMGIGHLDRMPGYRTVAAKAVRISGHDGDPAQLDGDCRGNLPLEIGLGERPLSVIVP
ncbi:diacylglycerol kinase family protein [Microvirga sp. VF16]|uniref:diacylglycerol/lipid kinase family protein n=1 Tax=Microvirga sp. VF16 TaxID=2807101 RepID=UPI00193EA3F3|nr:diacylglycerol kinase family protein [Microvirga sp. VF16]QRM31063.1 diacylglycerol kinase family lipid kinase [Microvirga sp. VF16]